ncbi:unnamed protein product [Brassica rapa]|uniref:Uncharacterized protein n=1 Tax=Brassica campestris TaxID=3711 RepID=A0A8D9FYY6_BRACM|nr:unnamed protein product [Brassica rapa]
MSCVSWRTPTDTHGHTRTATDVLCVLTDSHRQPQASCVRWRTPTDVLPRGPKSPEPSTGRASGLSPRTSVLICVLMDSHGCHVCADRNTDVLCVLTDTHGRPVCADRQPQTATNILYVLCVLADTHRRPVCTKQTAHKGQNHPNSPQEGASMLSPRTSVLICVLMDSHGRPVCTDGHTQTHRDVLCVLTDTHGRPVCADGQPLTATNDQRADMCTDGQPRTSCPRTSCVCWRTPMDVLCVLSRQPTWAKITQTVQEKGQRAESKDQRADMYTDGQPRMSTTNVLCVLMDTHGHTQTATDVLCVLTNTHGRPVCTEQTAHPRTSRPVCASGHPQTFCVYSTDSPQGIKSPKQSTGRVSVLNPRTNVLICVLMDSHGRPVCADGHTQTHTDNHGCPVCADGHTRTSYPTWAKISQTVHGKGQRAESKDQRADMSTDILCVLTDTHGHTRTAPDVLCVLTDTHICPPRTSCVCWRTPTDILYSPRGPKSAKQSTGRASVLSPRTSVLIYSPRGPNSPKQSTGRASVLSPKTSVLICVLMDSHGRPPQTSCVCWQTPTDVLCVLNRQPTWAKITQTVHGKGQRAESKDQRADM